MFADPLCKLLNLSISTNSFPNHWKIAKVTPLHKGGARKDINNYRSISVLPVLSKILEKHVANSLSKFLCSNNLLYELQSAFRPGHSTETALIRLTDQILMNMDNDEVTGLVFIDFRKASDVTDHELLLKKLSTYGASPSSVAWFRSYLSEAPSTLIRCQTKTELFCSILKNICVYTYGFRIVFARPHYNAVFVVKTLLYPQCACSNELDACAFQYIGPQNWRELEATW